MRWKQLHESKGQRTLALVLQTGEEAMTSLKGMAQARELRAAQFTAIGAFSDAVIAFFDWDDKAYHHITVREQVEVLSLVGDITLKDGEPVVHAHVVLGKRDGSAHGGHLIEAHVRPTLEVMLVESPGYLERRFHAESGLSLVRLDPDR